MVSVSATTRLARPGEVEGQSYFFVTDEQFDQLVETNGLLEWALVHGSARYGTPRHPVERAVAEGRVVVLEIELQGARQVRQSYPDACHIFLKPPSWDELRRRLAVRGTETAEQQARRLETAKVEMAAADEFDVVVVNRDVDDTVSELAAIMGLGVNSQ